MSAFELRATDVEGFEIREAMRCREAEIVQKAVRLHRAFRGVRVELWRDGLLLSALPARH